MGNDLSQCHPRLQALAEKLVGECGRQGYPVGIGECFRSVAERNALYAQGRTGTSRVSDGIFGNAAKAAVMEFQKPMGLSIDGIVGKATWSKLLGL